MLKMAFIRTRTKTIFPNRDARKFKNFWIEHSLLIEAILKRLEQDNDSFLLVTGSTGRGKSITTALFNLKYLAEQDNIITKEGKMFTDDNFIVDPEEFAVKMITKKGESLWIDEGRKAGNRQQWQDKVQQLIIERKNTNRKNNNVYWFLMPFETEFNPRLASHLTCWIWMKKRHLAEVYVASSGRKGGRGLNIQEIIDREQRWLKENPKANDVIPWIHPEFRGRMRIGRVPKEYINKYNKLVEEKKAIGELSEDEKEKYGIDLPKTPEEIINEKIEKIKKGEINNKRILWNELKEETGLEDKELKEKLNFYLNLEGFPTFLRLFKNKKQSKKDFSDLF